jgi:hypothetical protein
MFPRISRRVVVGSLALLAAACGGATQSGAVTPAEVEAAAARSPSAVAASRLGKHCGAELKIRDKAACYLESGSEQSIDPLFELGSTLAHRANASDTGDPLSWQDFTYAAENAGVLAAKTREDRLYAGLTSPDETHHLFAVVAIRHMLAILRQGNAHGTAADAPVRAERLAHAHAACLTALGAGYAMMVRAGADCLREIGDPTDGGPLLEAVIGHPNDSKLQAHLASVALTVPHFPAETLPRLRPILEQPLTAHWCQEDIDLKAAICTILARELPATEPWPEEAAAAAAREVGDRRGGQARLACQQLAARPAR